MNGVIKVVRRAAPATQGALIAAGAGTRERGLGGARFENRISGSTRDIEAWTTWRAIRNSDRRPAHWAYGVAHS